MFDLLLKKFRLFNYFLKSTGYAEIPYGYQATMTAHLS